MASKGEFTAPSRPARRQSPRPSPKKPPRHQDTRKRRGGHSQHDTTDTASDRESRRRRSAQSSLRRARRALVFSYSSHLRLGALVASEGTAASARPGRLRECRDRASCRISARPCRRRFGGRLRRDAIVRSKPRCSGAATNAAEIIGKPVATPALPPQRYGEGRAQARRPLGKRPPQVAAGLAWEGTAPVQGVDLSPKPGNQPWHGLSLSDRGWRSRGGCDACAPLRAIGRRRPSSPHPPANGI